MNSDDQNQLNLADALCDIAAVLNSTLQLDEVLDRILINIEKVVPLDAANIMLIENDISRVVRTFGYRDRKLEDMAKNLVIKTQETPSLQLMATTGEPLAIPDTAASPGWVSFPTSGWIKSYAAAPIMINGKAVGFLNLDSATAGFYSQVHANRLQAFANHAAVAIHNAQLYERVKQLAITDDLTGLYNRRGLFELGQREIDRAVRYNHPLTILMFDIDDFKQFNDDYSYMVGDEVLKMLAARCRAHVREVDIVARYGGDEFVVLLVENDLPAAARVAERLRKAIYDEPFSSSRGNLQVSVSIGITAFTVHKDNLSTLLEKVGEVLHAAKREGRNHISIL